MNQHPVENDPRTFAIIGAAMEVHNVFGYGFLEAVYRHAFSIELQLRGVPFITEVPYPVC
jgi:GxxExxY protein